EFRKFGMLKTVTKADSNRPNFVAFQHLPAENLGAHIKDDALITTTTCYACFGSNTGELKVDGQPVEKEGYRFERCSDCALVYVAPMPKDEVIRAFYQDYHK
mgnify:CR=1